MANTTVTSILSMAGLGLFCASILAVVNQKLKVKEDPVVERIAAALPGVNCGACGFTSCYQYAEALAKGKVSPDMCRAGGEIVTNSLCEILGVKAGTKTKEIAVVHCGADFSKRKKKANYVGIKTCVAVHNTFGGETLCAYGCLGYGDCVRACPFGAIDMVKGLPKISKDKCVACGKCVLACPRKLISVEQEGQKDFLYVACNSREKGPETRKTCAVGCVACGICQKLTNGIFYIDENLAHVRYEKIREIKNAKELIDKCPAKCILEL